MDSAGEIELKRGWHGDSLYQNKKSRKLEDTRYEL